MDRSTLARAQPGGPGGRDQILAAKSDPNTSNNSSLDVAKCRAEALYFYHVERKEIQMGLDMYLYARKYVSGVDYSRTNDELVATPNPIFTSVISSLGMTIDELSEDFPSAEVSLKVGYWRKDNQIHSWFVSNVQGGEDNCEQFHVSREQLLELRDVCRKVVADNSLAGDLLPPQGGFFFGSTDLDEWYFEGVEKTITILDRILTNPKFEDTGMFSWDFYYQSSW